MPADATVIRAEGKFVVPGLIDAHLHYSGIMAELLLNHGVTTAFDIAGLDLHQVVRRDAIDRGRMVGPRLFVPVDSVLAPTEPGHVCYARQERRGAISVDEAVRIARGAFADGADYLNIRRGLRIRKHYFASDVGYAAPVDETSTETKSRWWSLKRLLIVAAAVVFGAAAGVYGA